MVSAVTPAPSLAARIRRELPALLCASLWPAVWLIGLVLLPELPGMAAAMFAFAIVLVVPGLAILLVVERRWNATEAAVLSVLLGVAQLAILSVPALLIHLPLAYALVPHVLVTVFFAYAALRRSRGEVVLTAGSLSPVIGAMFFMTALFATAGDNVARGGDNWQTMPFVASYAAGEDLNERSPTFDTSDQVLSRYVFNVFAVDQAAMVELAEIDVVRLNLDYFPAIAVALGGLGVFALGSRISGSQLAGYIALAILAFAVLVDLSAQESYGINFLVRAGEDKFFAAFALFPGFALLCMSAQRGPYMWFLLLLGAAALTLTHPFGIAFAGFGLTAMVVGSGLESRRSGLAAAAGAAAILLLLAIAALYQRYFVDDLADFLFAGTLQARIDLRRLDLPGPLLILHPAMVTQPLIWVAIAITPFLLRRLPDRRAQAFVALTMLALPAALFFPPTATVLGRVASPGLLWRFLTVMPVVPVLATGFLVVRSQHLAAVGATTVVAVVTVLAIEGSAQVNEEVYLFQGDHSAVLGGLDRAFSDDHYWRRPGNDRLRTIAQKLEDRLDSGAVILLPPAVRAGRDGSETFLDLSLPVLTPTLDSYTDRRQIRLGRFDLAVAGESERGVRARQAFSNAFYGRRYPPTVPIAALFDGRSITHVLVLRDSYLHARLGSSRSFQNLGILARSYVLFEFLGVRR